MRMRTLLAALPILAAPAVLSSAGAAFAADYYIALLVNDKNSMRELYWIFYIFAHCILKIQNVIVSSDH